LEFTNLTVLSEFEPFPEIVKEVAANALVGTNNPAARTAIICLINCVIVCNSPPSFLMFPPTHVDFSNESETTSLQLLVSLYILPFTLRFRITSDKTIGYVQKNGGFHSRKVSGSEASVYGQLFCIYLIVV
jgi:hypothetical protein